MSQVPPVYVELDVIVHMYEFMYHGLFHVFLAHEVPLAKYDRASLGREAPRAHKVTRRTRKVLGLDVGSSEFEVLHHEHNGGA